VYALGAMTYEMLIGDPPFTGSTAQAIVAKVMTADPASLTEQRRSVPAAVEDAVLTALEKLPADRFATAAEFADALAGRTPSAAPKPAAADHTAVASGGTRAGRPAEPGTEGSTTKKKGCAAVLIAGVGLAGAAAGLFRLLL
jgi:serine/threonine-protein kinase